MGRKILLDVAPTGVQHSIDIDNDGGGFTSIEFTPTTVENSIIDECARLRNLHQRPTGAFRHAAKTPVNTWAAWRREWMTKYRDTWTWPTFEAMKLNSRDNEKLRTGHKRSGAMKL